MNLFSFIKSRVAILDVIGSYVTLKKAGHYWKSPCPFHSEKTGSFTVSPHKEIFYCFGCHMHGDAISFVSKIENCTPVEAAQLLADRYNIEIPSTLGSPEKTTQKKRYYDLCQLVAQWCHQQLLKSNQASGYLRKRSFSSKSIQQFQIGYFPGGLAATKHFIQEMNKHHFLISDLLSNHIIVQGKNIYYSSFEERILFPIKDSMGNYCGFGGRIFKDADTRPKYYNSHENDYFSKGSLLFGLDNAKKEIQKKESVFLVEGYTDCIAMVQHGYGNTVATLGTACTLEHLKQLARYANTLYVVYDGDKAGQQAVIRMAQLCWQATLDLKVITLPSQDDPATYLQKGNDLTSLIGKAQDIFLFFIETIAQGFKGKSLNEKLQIIRKMIAPLATIEDGLKQDLLLQRASQLLEMPLNSLKKELQLHAESTLSAVKPEPVEQAAEPTNIDLPKLEKKIFFAIMNNIQLLQEKNAWYLITFLPKPLREIIAILHQEKQSNKNVDFSTFYDTLSPQDQQFVSRILLEGSQQPEERTFDTLLMQLQKNHWKVIVNDIKLKMEQAKRQKDDARVQELLEEFLNLRSNLLRKELI